MRTRDDGSVTFGFVRNVEELPSVIGSYVKERSGAQCTTPLSWYMSDLEILNKFERFPQEHALVINLKPREREIVSLYQVKDIWGYSYSSWTPVAIRLETLFVDKDDKNSVEFKRRFNNRDCKREQVYEFLYLQAGTKEGNWY